MAGSSPILVAPAEPAYRWFSGLYGTTTAVQTEPWVAEAQIGDVDKPVDGLQARDQPDQP